MRYVAGLIPERARVLPDYFKGTSVKMEKRKPLWNIILWLSGLFFFLIAVAVLYHPLLFLLLAAAGGVLLPPGARFLESRLRCRLTGALKVLVAAILLLSAIPLLGYYVKADNAEALRQEQILIKEAQEKAIAQQKREQLRLDSLRQREADYADASALFTTGKYNDALLKITMLLKEDSGNQELLYNRAVCYSKTGQVGEAVADLKQLMKSGNEKAAVLHDKINPLRQRVISYCTRCWDGTTSSATGRGACSHHGGVKEWNEPVYQEYRKYE